MYKMFFDYVLRGGACYWKNSKEELFFTKVMLLKMQHAQIRPDASLYQSVWRWFSWWEWWKQLLIRHIVVTTTSMHPLDNMMSSILGYVVGKKLLENFALNPQAQSIVCHQKNKPTIKVLGDFMQKHMLSWRCIQQPTDYLSWRDIVIALYQGQELDSDNRGTHQHQSWKAECTDGW
jgi:hypothetical protein